MKRKRAKTGTKSAARQTWPQTPQQALKLKRGGMYGTIPVQALPYSNRLE